MTKINFFLLTICFSGIVNAQAPQAISYQAVARNAQGQIVPAQNIGVRFSILDGSVTGNVLYEETHSVITNNFGLFTLSIGKGTPLSGTFAAIDWPGDKFLKVEIAPEGGTNYLLEGTTQLLSVPYALYAEKTHLIAGNAINITNGNTIAANYTGNNGVAVNGSTISGNYQAGTGINIANGVIAATAISSQWIPDTYGIYYQNALGGAGIGGNTESNTSLTVTQKATGGFSAAAVFKGNDTWHTVLRFDNTSTSPMGSMQLNLAGSGNSAMPPRAFSLYDGMSNRFVWITDGTNNDYLGIGSYSGIASIAKSRLHVFAGDVNIDQIGSGIIMKSPDGQCWRITIDNTGNLVRTAITCP
jgi:hypothetical protein